MLSKRILALLIFICILSAEALAQGSKLTGRVVDGQSNTVAYATVTLLKADSSIVNGDLTKEDGSFSIEATDNGIYRLRITALGYTTRTIKDINLIGNRNMGDITVTSNSKTLNEVQITGEKSMMEMKVDKKVFNVDKNITTAGGSATDVLSNVPSVSVDVDGSVSLRGKGNVNILIDGKPASLLGGDVTTALQSLPAGSIENVEVITNPGAKYDAQGVTGIINIVTKRNKKFGFTGSINAGVGTRHKYNGGLNLNMKNSKWNVFLNSNYRDNHNLNPIYNNRVNSEGFELYNNFEDGVRMFSGWFNSLGAEYTIDKSNTLNLTTNVNKMHWGYKSRSYLHAFEDNGYAKDTVSRRLRDAVLDGGPFSIGATLDYKHKFKKEKEELSVSLNYTNSWRDQYSGYDTYEDFDQQERRYLDTTIERAPGSGTNNNMNAQADYTFPLFGKDGKLDAGWKTQMFWFESKNNPTVWDNTTYTENFNSTLFMQYNYLQQIHAAYASYSNQVGNLSYQAGLRAEYTGYEGNVKRYDTASAPVYYANDFLNLFPSAFISYKMPKDQSIYLNFSRRTDRPGFFQLMPFLDLTNPLDTQMGNPNLRPEFIYNTEFSYNRQFSKGHNVIASLYYQYTDGLTERYRIFYADGTTFSQPQNLASGMTYGAELIARAQLNRIWDATVNFNFFNNKVRGGNIAPELDNSGAAWFAKANTNLKLPYDFALQLNVNYESEKILAQGRRPEVKWVDIALRKNLFKNKATIVVNVSDIFKTRKYTTIYELPAYSQVTTRARETQVGNITFTYRFGSSEGGQTPKGTGNGGRKKGQQKDKKEIKPEGKDRNNLRDNSDGGGQNG